MAHSFSSVMYSLEQPADPDVETVHEGYTSLEKIMLSSVSCDDWEFSSIRLGQAHTRPHKHT